MHLPPPQREKDVDFIAAREVHATENHAKNQKEAKEQAKKPKIDDVGKSGDSHISDWIDIQKWMKHTILNLTDTDAYNKCNNNMKMDPVTIIKNRYPF